MTTFLYWVILLVFACLTIVFGGAAIYGASATIRNEPDSRSAKHLFAMFTVLAFAIICGIPLVSEFVL